ncbi:hypothetical protein EVAR_64733_1 [Eumeta japonica]|uniref:Uncharacterized protein n=1 Tax=Eumeta variegata TaxID=151549 RepID=A0A4C1Z9E0_EUMVA|nr:hypothetical protein EVAR_64733_1 [Eumeta japonica]
MVHSTFYQPPPPSNLPSSITSPPSIPLIHQISYFFPKDCYWSLLWDCQCPWAPVTTLWLPCSCAFHNAIKNIISLDLRNGFGDHSPVISRRRPAIRDVVHLVASSMNGDVLLAAEAEDEKKKASKSGRRKKKEGRPSKAWEGARACSGV